MRRILMVGLICEGNLGDDLISHLMTEVVLPAQFPGAEIGVLAGPYPNRFGYGEHVRLLRRGRRRSPLDRLRRASELRRFRDDCELIVIGGGGLLQDTHFALTPHLWLRYGLLTRRTDTQVWLAGIGIGPIKRRMNDWYLRRALPLVDVVQVRDEHSREMGSHYGIKPQIGPDIVLGASLSTTPFRPQPRDGKSLGCSIRPWSGLTVEGVSAMVVRCCRDFALERADFFAFEHKPGQSEAEYEFSLQLAEHVSRAGIDSRIYCYGRDDIADFARAFCQVERAIAVRYHANILWQKLGIPVYPISYAPKVSAFYEESNLPVARVGELPFDAIDRADFLRRPCAESYALPTVPHATGSPRSFGATWFVRLFDALAAAATVGRVANRALRNVGALIHSFARRSNSTCNSSAAPQDLTAA